MESTWQRILTDVRVDWRTLHADVERVMREENKTFEQAMKTLPIGVYVQMKTTPAAGAD